jgi:hypothetical protein
MITLFVNRTGQSLIDLLPEGKKSDSIYFIQGIIDRLTEICDTNSGQVGHRKFTVHFYNAPIHETKGVIFWNAVNTRVVRLGQLCGFIVSWLEGRLAMSGIHSWCSPVTCLQPAGSLRKGRPKQFTANILQGLDISKQVFNGVSPIQCHLDTRAELCSADLRKI